MKKLLGFCVIALLSVSCATTHQGIKADLVGFSDDVLLSYQKNVPSNQVVGVGRHTPPYEIEKEDGYKQMRAEIMGMRPEGANTSLYFAKDVARKRVRYVRRKFLKRDPEAKIYMIIMTDGLENSSLQTAKNHHMGHCRKTINAYQQVVKKLTQKAMGKNVWQLYPIVFEGKDLKAMYERNNMARNQQQEFIKKQFQPLRGSKGAPLKGDDRISPQVSAASSAKDLANEFKDQFFSASFGFHIPKGYVGKSIKMQIKDTAGTKIAEFTGSFAKRGGKYIFKNVTKSGITCYTPKKGTWIATNKNNKKDLLAKFAFNDVKINGKALSEYAVEQHVEQQGIWVENTEYDAQAGTSQNAYIITILDGSESVGNDYGEMKRALMEMVGIATGRK